MVTMMVQEIVRKRDAVTPDDFAVEPNADAHKFDNVLSWDSDDMEAKEKWFAAMERKIA